MSRDQRIKYYRKFTNQRNQRLEQMLDNYRVRIADELRPLFMFMAGLYLNGNDVHRGIIEHAIRSTANNIEHLVMKMRKNVYLLTVASEAEILARVSGVKVQKYTKTHKAVDNIYRGMASGGTIAQRVVLHLNGIRRKLEALAEVAQVTGDKLTIQEVASAFPRLKPIPKKRSLQPIKEARTPIDDGDDVNMTVDSLSPGEWDDILADYQEVYTPVNRGPDAVTSDDEMLDQGRFPSGRYDDATYDWELEQDIAHDFVESVRNGQNDAAEQNGIVDMLWVSVVDNRTDDCCLWRDGLTTAEIDEKLKGERSDDECQGHTPPIHFNCRCTLEPATDDLPDEPMSNKGSFDDWVLI